MSDARDPMALLRHAAQVGDWALLEVVARVLSGGSRRAHAAGDRAYGSLVFLLGLSGASYDRA